MFSSITDQVGVNYKSYQSFCLVFYMNKKCMGSIDRYTLDISEEEQTQLFSKFASDHLIKVNGKTVANAQIEKTIKGLRLIDVFEAFPTESKFEVQLCGLVSPQGGHV